MKRYLILFGILCLLGNILTVSAQRRNQAYEEYIHKYRELAIHEMKRYRIPASITLAQGLLESSAGKSTLARKSNNHFGIKCGSGWNGKRAYHTDDAPNECFRAYKHPKDSYEDHSKFLRTKTRYAFLFELKVTDYKGWARGLKKAGYATDPRYANRLIDIIELYDLYEYDQKGKKDWMKGVTNPHQPYLANDLLYIIAREGDTFKSIAKEFDLSKKKVRTFNELPKDYEFSGGEVVYLEEKHKHATNGFISCKVYPGDSMYTIAQRYGVKLKYLYRLNDMKPEDGVPPVGSIIWLQ